MAKKRKFRTNPMEEWNADNREYDPGELIDKIDEILEDMDDASSDLWDRAYEYFESCEEKLKGIRDTVEKKQEVSRRQWETVENMISGINKWLKNDRD